ncbi:MAG: EamA family transporter [Chloroflexi bacterium]|nr:EamA family transporter [Chloroflexota bacterium]
MTHALPAGGQLRGVLIALAGTAAWATTAIIMRTLMQGLNIAPLTLAVWRDVTVVLILFLVLRATAPHVLHIRQTDLPFLLLHGGVSLAAMNALWALSLGYNGATLSTVLIYLAPGVSALGGWAFLHEPITRWKIAAVVLGLAGVVLIVGVSTQGFRLTPTGIVIGLTSAVGFAAFSLTGKVAARRFQSTRTGLFYGFVFATLALILLALAMRSPAVQFDKRLVLGLLVLAVPTLLGYGLFSAALRYLPASVATLIASLEPALTAIMAVTLLGEQLAPVQWAGSGLIVAGVMLVQRASNGPARDSSQASVAANEAPG